MLAYGIGAMPKPLEGVKLRKVVTIKLEVLSEVTLRGFISCPSRAYRSEF